MLAPEKYTFGTRRCADLLNTRFVRERCEADGLFTTGAIDGQIARGAQNVDCGRVYPLQPVLEQTL